MSVCVRSHRKLTLKAAKLQQTPAQWCLLMESWVMCAGCVRDAWIGRNLCMCPVVSNKEMGKDKGMSIGDTNTVQPEYKCSSSQKQWVGAVFFNTKLSSTFLLQGFTPTLHLPSAPCSMSSALSCHTAHTALPSSSSALPLLFHVSFPLPWYQILTQDIQSLLLPFSACETDVCGGLPVFSPLENNPQSALNQGSELRGNFSNGVTQADDVFTSSGLQTALHWGWQQPWSYCPTSLQLLAWKYSLWEQGLCQVS